MGYSENQTDIIEKRDVESLVAHFTGKHTGRFALPGMEPIAPTGRLLALPPEPAWVRVRDAKLIVYHVTKVVGGGGIDGILQQIGDPR